MDTWSSKEEAMSRIYLAIEEGLAVLRNSGGRYTVEMHLLGHEPYALAADPLQPAHLFCGTFKSGLWRSHDAGTSWHPVGEGIPYAACMSVAVSASERIGEHGVVWAGTEPSALFRSEDGGIIWQECSSLRQIPSAPTWSFPPRPWTSHVRAIALDPRVAERLFVGIELGGVMRSLDRGQSWEDRKPGSQHDTHALATHRLAPGRVYETAGGGYAESRDGGATWAGDDAGLRHRYLWGLAVAPADPDIIVISAAHGPRQAHSLDGASSQIYRKQGASPWQPVEQGLPAPTGNRAYVLATTDMEPTTFYAANEHGLYRSADTGHSWERIDIAWPREHTAGRVHAMLITEA
jgi:hypothetical protein